MSARADHLLVITRDEHSVKLCREQGDEPEPREFLEIGIFCEADRSGFGHDCMAWWECDCRKTLTEKQWDDLYHDDDGPCPASPTGRHQPMMGTVMHPSHDCWAQVCDFAPDVARDLADTHNLGLGAHRVWLLSGYEELEFELAEVEIGSMALPGGAR